MDRKRNLVWCDQIDFIIIWRELRVSLDNIFTSFEQLVVLCSCDDLIALMLVVYDAGDGLWTMAHAAQVISVMELPFSLSLSKCDHFPFFLAGHYKTLVLGANHLKYNLKFNHTLQILKHTLGAPKIRNIINHHCMIMVVIYTMSLKSPS